MNLQNRELERYSRQLLIPGFGIEGQECLKKARVLVIGAGGLGCPVLLYLVGAGVGKIGVVDGDKVSLSNLHRQSLYTENDIGRFKADCAVEILESRNSDVELLAHKVFLDSDNANAFIEDYQVLVDCTDNFKSRYLINDLGVLNDVPVVYGSVHQFEGQVSVFNHQTQEGRSPNYRDLFPNPPKASSVQNCSEGGVLGVLPGIIGSFQAMEVIKILTGLGEPLSSRLLLYNALDHTYKTINYNHSEPRVRVDRLIDYDEFCGVPKEDKSDFELLSKEVKELVEAKRYRLVDIRSSKERALTHIGGEHVEMTAVVNFIKHNSSSNNFIFYCRSGQRSKLLVEELQHNFEGEFKSLKGGLLAYLDYWGIEGVRY
jgi:molybdopterin/thiamine biosynthesis adenylyltransferase/rhodanese-related sulfurtransferase